MPEYSWMSLAAAALPLLAAASLKFRRGPLPWTVLWGTAAAALALSAADTALDVLSRLAMTLFSGINLLTLIATPKRDRTREFQIQALLVAAGTLAAYATGNLLVLLAGWILSSIPLWKRPSDAVESWALPRFIAMAGNATLAAAIFGIAWQASHAGADSLFSIASLTNVQAIDNRWLFGLLIAAVLARKCVVPLHGGLVAAFEKGSPLAAMLYMNGHLGIFLIVRVAMPLLPGTSREALSPLADVALVSAACAALMGLMEMSPRRLLALVSVSQVSFLLAGLESGSAAGVNGALGCLVVLSIGTTGLFLMLRLLEARLSVPLTLDRFHGLATKAPRLAALFSVCGLALVGLPGTLGFVSEDLLFHGTLESHPELGLVLPIATALNAISLFRMFVSLFFGRRNLQVPAVADASPRERIALTAMLLPLLVLGIFPAALLSLIESVSLLVTRP